MNNKIVIEWNCSDIFPAEKFRKSAMKKCVAVARELIAEGGEAAPDIFVHSEHEELVNIHSQTETVACP